MNNYHNEYDILNIYRVCESMNSSTNILIVE